MVGMDAQDKGMTHILGMTEVMDRDSITPLNGAQFKKYELFISRIVHVMLSVQWFMVGDEHHKKVKLQIRGSKVLHA